MHKSNCLWMLLLLFATTLLCGCKNKRDEGSPTLYKCKYEEHPQIKDSVLAVKSDSLSNANIRERLENELKDEDKPSNSIYGLWATPHGATTNIVFFKDGTFRITKYFKDQPEFEEDYQTGTYKTKGDSIILTTTEGWTLRLRHWECWGKGEGIYITQGNKDNWYTYLVKFGPENLK